MPEVLLGGKYGHHLHFWDLRKRRHVQTLDLGEEHQIVFELRPAHDPTKAYGFVGVVVSLKDLSSSIWIWYRDGDAAGRCKKVIEIPAEPADPDQLPPALKAFKAVPPLVTDIDLSMDDRFLYVSCWGTGELQQYDVSDPFNPKQTGTVRIGGIVARAAHPSGPAGRSTAGRRWSRSAATAGASTSPTRSTAPSTRSSTRRLNGWMVKLDADPDGGIAFDPKFFLDWPKGHRPHQVRLQGGDCSSDSYCYP